MIARRLRNWSRCPVCGAKGKVTQVYEDGSGRYCRRRRCPRDGRTWTTVEELRESETFPDPSD